MSKRTEEDAERVLRRLQEVDPAAHKLLQGLADYSSNLTDRLEERVIRLLGRVGCPFSLERKVLSLLFQGKVYPTVPGRWGASARPLYNLVWWEKGCPSVEMDI